MTATAITAEDLIRRYADDIAYVAEKTPTADLGALADQLGTAARPDTYRTHAITGPAPGGARRQPPVRPRNVTHHASGQPW